MEFMTYYPHICLAFLPFYYITYLYEIKKRSYGFKFISVIGLTLLAFVPLVNIIAFLGCLHELFTGPLNKLEYAITRFIRGKNGDSPI